MSRGNRNWLDDPEWEFLRRKSEKKPIPKDLKQKMAAQQSRRRSEPERTEPRVTAKKEVSEKEVVVNLKLALPKVKLPDFKQLYKVYRRKIWILGGVFGLLLIFWVSKIDFNQNKVEGVQTPANPIEQAKAEFNPLVPLDNPADVSGNKTSPDFRFDQEKKVLAYASKYNGINLVVSQQEAPDKLKADPGQLTSIALAFNANKSIQSQNGPVFLGTDSESEVQTAIFATKEVMVFIRAEKAMDDEDWRIYVNQLIPRD